MRTLNFLLNVAGGVAILLILPVGTGQATFGLAVSAIALVCVLSAWGFNSLNKAVDPVATTLIWAGGCALAVLCSAVAEPTHVNAVAIATIVGASLVALVKAGAAEVEKSWILRMGGYIGPLMYLGAIAVLIHSMGMWQDGWNLSDLQSTRFFVTVLGLYALMLMLAKSGVNGRWLASYLQGALMGWGVLVILTVVVLWRDQILGFWSIVIPLVAVFVFVEGRALKAAQDAIVNAWLDSQQAKHQ